MSVAFRTISVSAGKLQTRGSWKYMQFLFTSQLQMT